MWERFCYRIGCLILLPVYALCHALAMLTGIRVRFYNANSDWERREYWEGYPLFWAAFKAGERQ